MLALIAGKGALPGAVAAAQPEPPLICALGSSPPDSVAPDRVFDLERLGGFMRWLRAQGVTHVCLCGAVSRPQVRWWRMDARTLFLLPRILKALRSGDDSALRIAISILEAGGFTVVAAHEAAPALLLQAGVPTVAKPDAEAEQAALQGDAVSIEQGQADLGQACVVAPGKTIAREDISGTDAMLVRLGAPARGAWFYKATKPGQDRRADLPVVGPDTARRAAEKGLAGLIIEAGGVMVLDAPKTLATLDQAGLSLWIRERAL
ncbi:LpxI family protein [Thalassococcus lentus]|uniref:UDP-2,3-diacylglucosamine diphosphatase LpxI n=1 Tax=Thalassococcus lentus TaxID=1210524 RepID=A0ABT4XQM7_9RHOB|nr:UDP-2,3-diacylglucosamine diphosphatase LpxI [Thalassococcus lentus]MDA7424259.1 UDP-2,3-diacylglucosamine diphosphatase LpxI [Thalassococcus lentus]